MRFAIAASLISRISDKQFGAYNCETLIANGASHSSKQTYKMDRESIQLLRED